MRKFSGALTTDEMTNGPLLGNIIRFALPVMFTTMLQMLFNAADTIVVGKFAGETALAAVGATGSIISLLVSLFNGLGAGANVVIAQCCGSRDDNRISKAVHTSMGVAVACGILLTVVGIAFTEPLLRMMGTPDSIISLSGVYMRVYFAGSVSNLVYNLGAAILRAKGDSQRPLYFLMAGGVLNVVMNLLFVIVFKMSVFGVALATVLSQTLSAALVIIVLMREQDATKLILSHVGLDKVMAEQILRIGIPAGIQGMVYSFSNVFIQSAINSFDSSLIVAGSSAAANIEGFVYIAMAGFSQAAITFTSQCYGAAKYKRIRSIMLYTLVLDVGLSMLLGIAAFVFGRTLLGFYTNDVSVIEYGLVRLKWVAMPVWLNGLLDIFVCSMRGMDISTMPTVTMMGSICGVRLIWILLIFPHINTYESIFACYPLSWAITSVVLEILWHHFYTKLVRVHI